MDGFDCSKRQVTSLQRYFIDEEIEEEEVTIHGDDAGHINRVMRMKPGDSIICCGTDGRCAECRILEISVERVMASVVAWLDRSNELPVGAVIAQALPKGDKLDLIVQKGTELGAQAFLPFEADRSIVKWDTKKREKKAARLQRIAKEAAEQSQRSRIPKVSVPVSFQQLLDRSREFDVKIIAYEEVAKAGEQNNLASVLQQTKAGDTLLLVIGPEGGLTEQEITMLESCDFIACGLGPRILRTETAGLYVLAAMSYQSELLR